MGAHLASCRMAGHVADQAIEKCGDRNPARDHQGLVTVVAVEIVMGRQMRRQHRACLVPGRTDLEEGLSSGDQFALHVIDATSCPHPAVVKKLLVADLKVHGVPVEINGKEVARISYSSRGAARIDIDAGVLPEGRRKALANLISSFLKKESTDKS